MFSHEFSSSLFFLHIVVYAVFMCIVYTLSQKTSHLWYAITLTHVYTFWYFWQKKQSKNALFTVPPQVTCASALPGKTWKHENRIFHSNSVSVHCQSWTSRSLISSVFMTHRSYGVVWLPKSCNQCVQLVAVMGAWFRRNEVESAAAVALCWTHNACAPMRCLPERKKISSVMFDSVWLSLRY